MDLAEVPVPTSAAALGALEVARAYSSPALVNHCLRSYLFAAGAGWPVERRDRAARAIVDHMLDDVDAATDPEGHLLMVSTSYDISGQCPEAWSDALVREVVAAHPRLDLKDEFAACFADQARRKPDSAAASSVASGIAARLSGHPLESLQ